MGNLDQKLLRSLVFTRGCALYALYATHPDKEALKGQFVDLAKKLVDGLKEDDSDEEFRRMIHMHVDRFLDWLP